MFGSWARAEVPSVTAANATNKPTTLVLVDKPGAAQSSFRIGGIGAARSTNDYFALQVMNTMLGGSFGSRLNQNLREKHGFDHSVERLRERFANFVPILELDHVARLVRGR